jgi:hypothetical protein
MLYKAVLGLVDNKNPPNFNEPDYNTNLQQQNPISFNALPHSTDSAYNNRRYHFRRKDQFRRA